MGDNPGNRLTLFRESNGLTQDALASMLGTSRTAISLIENGQRTPSKNFLLKISDVYGVSSDWLLNGQGEMQRALGPGFKGSKMRIEPPDYAKPAHGDFQSCDIDYSMIRRMDLSVSAGSGVVALEGQDAASVALPSRWLSSAAINANLSVLVSVKGDSMSPAIPDGAFVLVHLPEKAVTKAGIYAFNLDGQSFVKRLVPSEADGEGRPLAISIISDNPAFPPKVLTGRKLNDMRVVGRVRAVLAML
jgi:phage repressor protein C with HTH and peptisase S24 domain